jgi:hypothetical protein
MVASRHEVSFDKITAPVPEIVDGCLCTSENVSCSPQVCESGDVLASHSSDSFMYCSRSYRCNGRCLNTPVSTNPSEAKSVLSFVRHADLQAYRLVRKRKRGIPY